MRDCLEKAEKLCDEILADQIRDDVDLAAIDGKVAEMWRLAGDGGLYED